MAGCAPISFNGVTPQVWDRLRAEARRMCVEVPDAPRGSVSAQGALARYQRDLDAGTLTVTFTQVPIWIDCASVVQRLRDAVRACGGA